MRQRQRFAGRLALGAAALLLLACSPQPLPTPRPATATPPPPRTIAAPSPTPQPLPIYTPVPSPSATPDDFAGWQTARASQFSIRLPAGWQALETPDVDVPAMAATLEPYRAVARWLPEPADDGEGPALLAVRPGEDSSASLTILRAALGAQRTEDPGALFPVFIPQLERMGLQVTGQRADLRTDGGLPMGRLSFAAPATAKGQLEASGEQYYVLTESDLWVLTFTVAGMQVGSAPPEFEQSARSFALR